MIDTQSHYCCCLSYYIHCTRRRFSRGFDEGSVEKSLESCYLRTFVTVSVLMESDTFFSTDNSWFVLVGNACGTGKFNLFNSNMSDLIGEWNVA